MPSDQPTPQESRAAEVATTRVQRRTAIHNEQTRIRANLLNTIAAGFVVAGVITPLASAAITGAAVTGATGF